MITMRPLRATSPIRQALPACLAAATMLGGGALIAGCGSSSTLDPVARAAEVSSNQAGIAFTLKVTLTSAAPSKNFSITAQGYVDQRRDAGRMSMDFGDIPAISALPGAGSGVEAVFLYPSLYMKMPFLADKLPEGKSWMMLDMAKLVSSASGGTVPPAFSIGQADPSQFLMYLRSSSGAVRQLGHQQLDGLPTTGYQATLQLNRVLRQLPLGDRAAARTMLSHAAGAAGIPVDVWIDNQRRVRRIQMSLKLAGGVASGPARIAIDFTSYGPVPSIDAPKAGEVIDLTSLVSSMGASAHIGEAGW